MKDENIKEILEDVKRHLDYVEATKQCSIRDNEMKAMYDYITNLQEEKEIIAKDFKEVSEKYFFTKSRNKKAIEYMKKWGEEPDADMYMQMKQYKEFQYLLNILQNGEQNWEWIPVYNTTNSEGE